MAESRPQTAQERPSRPAVARLVLSAALAWRDALRSAQARRRRRTGVGTFGIVLMVLGTLVLVCSALGGSTSTETAIASTIYIVVGLVCHQIHRHITHPGRRPRK